MRAFTIGIAIAEFVDRVFEFVEAETHTQTQTPTDTDIDTYTQTYNRLCNLALF